MGFGSAPGPFTNKEPVTNALKTTIMALTVLAWVLFGSQTPGCSSSPLCLPLRLLPACLPTVLPHCLPLSGVPGFSDCTARVRTPSRPTTEQPDEAGLQRLDFFSEHYRKGGSAVPPFNR